LVPLCGCCWFHCAGSGFVFLYKVWDGLMINQAIANVFGGSQDAFTSHVEDLISTTFAGQVPKWEVCMLLHLVSYVVHIHM